MGFSESIKVRTVLHPGKELPQISSDEAVNDERELLRLGKRPVMKRNFGFWSILGVSCTVLITWEGALIVSTQSLLNGGPAGVIWDFLIVWIGTFSTFVSISELASMAPTSGGQYHWVAMLAPASSRKILSYVTGWTTTLGWQAVSASAAYLTGTLIQGVAVLSHPDFAPKPWQTMLMVWAVILFAVFVNSFSGSVLARVETAILILHLLGFLAVIIPFVSLGPHGDASIFTTFSNQGNWPSQTLSFLVGLPGPVFSLIGADSAVHLSEEIQRASVIVPRALLMSIVINGILGFAMMIALMFCIGDIDSALGAVETVGYPFIEVFQQAVRSTAGACMMVSIVLLIAMFSVVSIFASTSRMLWSFARDHGTPFSGILSKLATSTGVPIYTVVFTTTVSVLLSLITLGSSVAFNNVVSLSVVGLYSSYLLTCGLLLWRRMTRQIMPYNRDAKFVGHGQLSWGPWVLSEPWGTMNNAFACVYLVWLLFWSFWPPATPVEASNMNFSVLVFGAVILFSIVWYMCRGRKEFDGPVIEVDVESEFA